MKRMVQANIKRFSTNTTLIPPKKHDTSVWAGVPNCYLHKVVKLLQEWTFGTVGSTFATSPNAGLNIKISFL